MTRFAAMQAAATGIRSDLDADLGHSPGRISAIARRCVPGSIFVVCTGRTGGQSRVGVRRRTSFALDCDFAGKLPLAECASGDWLVG